MGRAAAAPDAPTFSTFTSTTVDATSITIGRPAGTVAGDLLIAAVNHAVSNQYLDDVIITPPGDWTQIDHGICFDNVCTLGVWFKVAGGSEPSSYTFSCSHTAALASGAILLYKGADPSDPIDLSGAAAGFSDSPMAPNVTTTVVFTTVLRIAGVDDAEFDELDDDDSPYPPGLTGLFVMSAHFGLGPDPSLAAADTRNQRLAPRVPPRSHWTTTKSGGL